METLLMPSAASSSSVLRRLMEKHAHSLACYLASARPWYRAHQERLRDVFDQIAMDHRYLVASVGERLLELTGVAQTGGSFPMEFTQWHDLSADYILHLVRENEREIREVAEAGVAELNDDAESQGLAYEALGMARGHLETLDELMASAATDP